MIKQLLALVRRYNQIIFVLQNKIMITHKKEIAFSDSHKFQSMNILKPLHKNMDFIQMVSESKLLRKVMNNTKNNLCTHTFVYVCAHAYM